MMAAIRNVDFRRQRELLVEQELRAAGIRDQAVLESMAAVPREEFVSPELAEFAYRNVPLPIESDQTISQPYIVAYMAEALDLAPDDRVLEIGTGSGYAAAVLSRIAKEVFTVERHAGLARVARQRLEKLDYGNVHVLHADGTRGWPDEAPFDAIVVAASGPGVPRPLLEQLAIGGRLVIPVGKDPEHQKLVRVIRRDTEDYEFEELVGVRFVPLVGEEGWQENGKTARVRTAPAKPAVQNVAEMIRDAAEAITSPEDADFEALLDRIGDRRLVLIGEATHGTSEFYRIRAEITKTLIERKGFDFVAVEADWPDAYRIHDYVTHRDRAEPYEWEAFSRFPTWMWRNQEVLDFVHWLRDFNLASRTPDRRAGFYGLDLYSLFTSIHRVLEYLGQVDPATAQVARTRYGCLTPWESDPASYGHAALTGRYRTCESDVVAMLGDMLRRRVEAATRNGEALFDAQLNARLIADAERYYRIMYYGSDDSWNHRDTHMFQTLGLLLDRHGPNSKAVVWEHNSHLGDAAATQFGRHGQINVGQLSREAFGDGVYAIGQGTDRGTVAAASSWEGALEIKQVSPSRSDSYEGLMHQSGTEAFLLPLTQSPHRELTRALAQPRLERAIGVIYRPETERLSHYFEASLSHQFDEWIWFDRTSAVRPLTAAQLAGHEPPHPFATIDE